jgi:hypothetical protein
VPKLLSEGVEALIGPLSSLLSPLDADDVHATIAPFQVESLCTSSREAVRMQDLTEDEGRKERSSTSNVKICQVPRCLRFGWNCLLLWNDGVQVSGESLTITLTSILAESFLETSSSAASTFRCLTSLSQKRAFTLTSDHRGEIHKGGGTSVTK